MALPVSHVRPPSLRRSEIALCCIRGPGRTDGVGMVNLRGHSSAIFRPWMLMLVPEVRKMARNSFSWISQTRLIPLVRASVVP